MGSDPHGRECTIAPTPESSVDNGERNPSMASGIQDVSITVISRIVTMLVGVASQGCLAWWLGPADRGSYAVCLVYATILSVVFTLGMDVATQYFIASRRIGPSQAASTAITLCCIGAAFAVIIGASAIYLPVAFFQKAPVSTFHLALVLVPGQMAGVFCNQILAALKDFTRLGLVNCLNYVVQLLAIVVFVGLARLGIAGAMLASICTALVSLTVVLHILHHRHQVRWERPLARSFKHILHYGARYCVASLSNMVDLQIGAVMLAMLANEEAIGLFSVATTLVGRVSMLPDSIVLAISPRLAADPTGRPDLAARSARMVAVFCGAGFLTLALAAPIMVPILFSAKFAPMVPVIWIIMLGDYIRISCRPFIPYINGTNRPQIFSVIIVVSMVTNLTLLLLLLPVWGLNGAAASTAISHGIAGLLLLLTFRKLSGLSLSQTWRPQKADLKFLLDNLRRFRARLWAKSPATPGDQPPEIDPGQR